MNRFVPAILVAIVLVGIFILMWRAWRSRRAQTSMASWAQDISWADDPIQETISDLFYVATTKQDSPLDRVLPPGLAFRGNASLSVLNRGVIIRIAGERPFAIPREAIAGCSVQQLTIDKVVEKDGLVALRWQSGAGPLMSVFRPRNTVSRERLLNLFQPTADSGEAIA